MNKPFVLVTSSFPIRGDGSEAAGGFVADLAEELATHVDVRVVAPGAQAQREQWTDRIDVYRYLAPPQPLSTLKPWRPRDLAWGWRALADGMRATREASAGASHLLALWALPCGEWARRAARAHGVGYSVWMLGSDVWTLGRVPVLRQMLARVIRQAACAYADGYQLADDSRRIAHTAVAFLPSTRRISTASTSQARERAPYRLLYLGRWHPNKGTDLLLDALTLLDDTDWRRIESVEIEGGGPMESLVRERAEVLRNAGRPVRVGHFLAKRDAIDAILRADWVVIPSRVESVPVVFSDAVKLGRPVIATPVGDLPRLVKGGCGVVATAVDPAAIASAIRHACETRGDTSALRACAKMFSLDDIGARILRGAGVE